MDQTCRNLRIVLVGKTGSGKSSAGNTILGHTLFEMDISPESFTNSCERGEAEIDGRTISVIDTPGLFDTTMTEKEMEAEIKRSVYMSVPGPHAFLLVIRLGVKYTEEEKNTVKWIQENFGEEATRYTIVLFTHADYLNGKTLDEYISESNDLRGLVHVCGGRFHSFNSRDTENRNQVTELLKKIDRMVKRNGGKNYTSEIYKQAQQKIEREAFKQKSKAYGKTALKVIGVLGLVGAAAVVTAKIGGGESKAVEVAGGAAVAAVAAKAAGAAAAASRLGI